MSVEGKIEYLKGLAEGLEISKDTKEGKLLLAIIDTLEEFSFELDDANEELTQLGEYVEELDDDLLALEEYIYDDEDDCDCCDCCDCDDEDCDCCDCCDCDEEDCDCCDCCDCDEEDCDCCEYCDCDECDDDFEYDEYVCPDCKETISFSGEFDEEELVCPNCGAKLEEA